MMYFIYAWNAATSTPYHLTLSAEEGAWTVYYAMRAMVQGTESYISIQNMETGEIKEEYGDRKGLDID